MAGPNSSGRSLKWSWWTVAAATIGIALLVLGVGNIVSLIRDDRRSAVSAIVAFLAASSAAALVFGGLFLRLRRPERPVGSWAIAVGVFPGSMAIVFFWFPPAVVIGVFCMVVTMRAVIDALALRETLTSPA